MMDQRKCKIDVLLTLRLQRSESSNSGVGSLCRHLLSRSGVDSLALEWLTPPQGDSLQSTGQIGRIIPNRFG